MQAAWHERIRSVPLPLPLRSLASPIQSLLSDQWRCSHVEINTIQSVKILKTWKRKGHIPLSPPGGCLGRHRFARAIDGRLDGSEHLVHRLGAVDLHSETRAAHSG